MSRRNLCKKLGYVLLEIYQNIDESQWNSEILIQIQNQSVWI